MPNSKKIVIEFNEEILNKDTSLNVPAFSVTGKEYMHVDGVLLDTTYTVQDVMRRLASFNAVPDFTQSNFNNTEYNSETNGIKLTFIPE